MEEMKKQYSCPMHPEIVQDNPGDCPLCGMKLVEKGSEYQTQHSNDLEDKGLGKITLKNYLPLLTIIGLILLSTLALTFNDFRNDTLSLTRSLTYFMIGFFLTFAGFKLIDLPGFAEGYHQYDLLAKHWFNYGYIYPFIELFFALAMIVGFFPRFTLWAEVIVMGFSGVGVLWKILKRERFKCVCLGTILKVPLTYVTLIEDFGMAALALLLLRLSQF